MLSVKKCPTGYKTGIEHYQKQLPRELNFSLITPEAQKRKSSNIEQIKQLEGKLLTKASIDANLVIAFDEHGKQHTTKEIANAMKKWQQNGDSVALLIGWRRWFEQYCQTTCTSVMGSV